jgi:DivIVA domain-containing protein
MDGLAPGEIVLFWFMLIALVAVVAAVALMVLGDGDVLSDAEPDSLYDPLPDDRPLGRADVDTLRLPTALRGYRMSEVDDVLDRLGAELTERDARIAELEAALAGVQASPQRTQRTQWAQRPGLGAPRSDLPGWSEVTDRTDTEGPR